MMVVTHEMRFARDASTRIFYMDRGEVWEQGPPSQIFGDPLRKETYDSVLRMRSWNWEVRDLDFDYPAMMSALEAFCERQFLGRPIANACQMAVEEIVARQLVPTAASCNVQDPAIGLTLGRRGGQKARLSVDCRGLVGAGVTYDDLLAVTDELSERLLDALHSHPIEDEPYVYPYIIE